MREKKRRKGEAREGPTASYIYTQNGSSLHVRARVRATSFSRMLYSSDQMGLVYIYVCICCTRAYRRGRLSARASRYTIYTVYIHILTPRTRGKLFSFFFFGAQSAMSISDIGSFFFLTAAAAFVQDDSIYCMCIHIYVICDYYYDFSLLRDKERVYFICA